MQIPLANCVYGNTYELVQPTAGSPLRVCIYTRIHTYARVYIYGAIKVQVNRGGGLHDSAASKFCGSYVASENAHHPKTQAASVDFLPRLFCEEYCQVYAIREIPTIRELSASLQLILEILKARSNVNYIRRQH